MKEVLEFDGGPRRQQEVDDNKIGDRCALKDLDRQIGIDDISEV